jgi:hypothetical protein
MKFRLISEEITFNRLFGKRSYDKIFVIAPVFLYEWAEILKN